MKKYFLITSILLCYSLFAYCQKSTIGLPDTINAKEGTIIITQLKDNAEYSKNKFRSSVNVIIKDEKTHSVTPLSFIGINKIRYQTSEQGTAKLFLPKGHYKISATGVGYQTIETKIKISLKYNYNIEIFLSPQSKMLY